MAAGTVTLVIVPPTALPNRDPRDAVSPGVPERSFVLDMTVHHGFGRRTTCIG
jgi:hypothetical protein